MEEFVINLRNCCGIQNSDIPLTCLLACYLDDISLKYRNRVDFYPSGRKPMWKYPSPGVLTTARYRRVHPEGSNSARPPY